MKKNLFIMMALVACICVMTSCGSKKAAVAPAVVSQIKTQTSLEGEKVQVETTQLQGIEMADAINEDGTDMIKRPFKWYAGIGLADNKQMAVELAQREAYATISRILNNAVKDEAERGNVANNGRVQQALTSHWQQFSATLTKGCEPFGSTSIQFIPSTRMYEATAKVAIRADRFQQLLNNAGNFKPSDLTGEDLELFIETNKAIMEAAKGK